VSLEFVIWNSGWEEEKSRHTEWIEVKDPSERDSERIA
jgi:hypothetical protein